MAVIDKKVMQKSFTMFQEFCEHGYSEHAHRGYKLRVSECNNTVSFEIYKSKKKILCTSETIYTNNNVFTQHDTLFEVSTVDMLYKYLYIIYHTKAQSKDLVVDLI